MEYKWEMGHTYHILHHFRDSIPSPIIVDIHVMAILISFINLIIDLDESVHPSLRNGEAFIGYESRMLFLFNRLLLATFFLPIFLLFVIFIIITLLLARPQNSTHFREVFLELKHRWSHQHFIQSTTFTVAYTELASENTNLFSPLSLPLAAAAIFAVLPFLGSRRWCNIRIRSP